MTCYTHEGEVEGKAVHEEEEDVGKDNAID